MHRGVLAIPFVLSALALVLAGASFVQMDSGSRSGGESPGSGERLARLARAAESLETRLEQLERSLALAPRDSSSPSGSHRGPDDLPSGEDESGGAADPAELVRQLEARLGALEHAETLAKLVHRGESSLKARAANERYAPILDPDLTPSERRERILAHWKRQGLGGLLKHVETDPSIDAREVILPVLSIARDAALEPELRAKILSEISYSELPELRPPLLELVTLEESPVVRQQAVRNLVSHADDVQAQNAILEASRHDVSEAVRGTASRRLERIYDVATEATPGSPITTLTPAELEQGVRLGLDEDVRKALPAGADDRELDEGQR